MRRTNKAIVTAILVVVVLVFALLSLRYQRDTQSAGAASSISLLAESIVGTWSGTTPGPDPVPLTVEFRADRTYVATQTPDGGEPETAEGRFTVLAPNQLRLETFESDLPPTIEDLSITLDGDTLTLRDQEGVDMIFTRVTP